MFQSSLYSRGPVWAQNLVLSGWAGARRLLRQGRRYRRLLAEAVSRERYTAEELEAYQERQLRRVLVHAGKHVPYYSEMFDQIGFDPKSASLPDGLSSIPLQSKKTILNAKGRLISSQRPTVRFSGSSSGTTGTPIKIQQDLIAINRENAFIERQLRWAGYKHNDRRVWIRGDLVVPADSRSGPYWRHNYADNMLMMSWYHLSADTAQSYIDAITHFRPRIIQAFPSSIAFLAKYLETSEQYCDSDCLSGVITSSETLDSEVRKVIEDRFRCRVFDWYGSFERVAAIGTCEMGKYHLISDYSYVEFIPMGEGLHEIVGTGFNNLLMPLIRYRTGDLVELDDTHEICGCGRNFPVIRRIIGRSHDCIKLSNGKHIARLGFVFHGVDGIAESQIVQDEPDAIRIRIVPFNTLSADAKGRLVANARKRLGTEIDIQIEIVGAIERTSSGKFRHIICNV